MPNLLECWIDTRYPISVQRVITDDELCFRVTATDCNGRKRTFRYMLREEVERVTSGNYTWQE